MREARRLASVVRATLGLAGTRGNKQVVNSRVILQAVAHFPQHLKRGRE